MTFAGQGAPLLPPPPPTDAAVGFTSASSVSSDGIIGKAMLEENVSSKMGGVISARHSDTCLPITRSTVILLQLFWVPDALTLQWLRKSVRQRSPRWQGRLRAIRSILNNPTTPRGGLRRFPKVTAHNLTRVCCRCNNHHTNIHSLTHTRSHHSSSQSSLSPLLCVRTNLWWSPLSKSPRAWLAAFRPLSTSIKRMLCRCRPHAVCLCTY
jgi:hypothetical protein